MAKRASLLVLAIVTVFGLGAVHDLASLNGTAPPSGVRVQAIGGASVQPSLSSEVLREVGILDLHARGFSGHGISIGVVDTGIDPGALQANSLVDFVDITDEGRVHLSSPMSPDVTGAIEIGETRYNVAGVPSKSGSYRIGVWLPTSLPKGTPAATALQSIPALSVLIADNYLPGQFDTVYLDTNGNRSFSDEQALEVFRNNRKTASIPLSSGSGTAFDVLVSSIEDNGAVVRLGFDAHGHGTAVASVLCGSRQGFQPLSPGVSVVAVKALGSNGEASWSSTVKGIREAISRRVQIVLVSSAPASPGAFTQADQEALADLAKQNPRVLFVIAAGNYGPGIGTLAPIGGSSNVLVVGGLVPSRMAQVLHYPPGTIVWPWTSRGPDSNGRSLDVLAVAAGPSLSPLWVSGSDVRLFEGTSCAAAYAGGTAALLLEALASKTSTPDGAKVKRLMLDTAQPLPDVTWADQGHGALAAASAVDSAVLSGQFASTRAVFRWRGGFTVDGFFDRDRIPGQIPITIDNLSPFAVELQMATPGWINQVYSTFSIAAVDQRSLELNVDAGSPGLYSSLVSGNDPSTPGVDLRFGVTAIVPRTLDDGDFRLDAVLDAGMVHREFIRIPLGLESFDVTLQVQETLSRSPRGRAALYVYDSAGRLAYQSDWLGIGRSVSTDSVSFRTPSSGVWELVVVSDPTLPAYGLDVTAFRLTARQSGLRLSGSEYVETAVGPGGTAPSLGLLSPGAQNLDVALILNGHNGFVRQGIVDVPGGRSVSFPLPAVQAGTRVLRFGLSSPSHPTARLHVYLYHLDTSTGQWREIAEATSGSGKAGEILLTGPLPGQYVAYVDVISDQTTSFRWLALAAANDPDCRITVADRSVTEVQWAAGTTVQMRAIASTGLSRDQYVVAWDASAKVLRAMVPVQVHSGQSRPLVTVNIGGKSQALMNVTLRAWDSSTLRPVDACVRVGDRWYQLADGHVTLVLPAADPAGLAIRSEYQGMLPWISSASVKR